MPDTPADDRTCGQVIHDLLVKLRPEDPAAYATTMREIAAVATAAARDPETAGAPDSSKDQNLSVAVEGDRLVISIGVAALGYVALTGPNFESFPDAEVTDILAFAADIRRALRREEEDGTTLVHRMLDQAALCAVEDGCESVDLREDADEDDTDDEAA